MPIAFGRAGLRARTYRCIGAWLVWRRADRLPGARPAASVLPVGAAALLCLAFSLERRGAWRAPRPPMLASPRCVADINGGAESKQDKEKQEAEAFYPELHPAVCTCLLCGERSVFLCAWGVVDREHRLRCGGGLNNISSRGGHVCASQD
jgi:hypothetical protein